MPAPIIFSLDDYATLAQALRVAAEVYDRDAEMARKLEHPRIAAQFNRQAIIAGELAKRLEEEGQ